MHAFGGSKTFAATSLIIEAAGSGGRALAESWGSSRLSSARLWFFVAKQS
jgi:hypothetical protein